MPKIEPKNKKPGRDTSQRPTIIAQTRNVSSAKVQTYQWWTAQNDNDLVHQLVSTANYLQKTQQYRVRGASIFSRIYSGKGLMNYALNSKVLDTSNQLPVRRPTMNVTQSCIDTLVSRLTQSKPRPVFLTDEGGYREQLLSKQYNRFIMGEFFRLKFYEHGKFTLRDGCVFGDGFVKWFEKDKRVFGERTLSTELFADKDDSWYGAPRQLVQVKLVDRNVLAGMFPNAKKNIAKAQKAYVDGSGESSETISDQVIAVEGWHLPSFKGAPDGRHAIVCSDGVVDDGEWTKDFFPFTKMAYNPHAVGYFSQGLAEMLMGTQLGIDALLRTISESIHLVGVPKVFIDELSKILEASLNNNVGTIVKFRGTPPIYQTPPCVAPEMYEHLMRLIQFAYQISGISALAATSQKPAGLNSGEAIRTYDDLQSDRFADLAQRYEQFYVDSAYQIMDLASDIAKRDGTYSTVYPDKDGTREIDLPKAGILKDSYVIQCYDESFLPRDPAGRQAKLSEMLQTGELNVEEYRYLSNFPDVGQSDKLANALRNRILKILNDIVEDGKEPQDVDAFLLDPTDMATTLATNYWNLYVQNGLEQKRLIMISDFITQIQTLKQQAAPPPMAPMGPQGQGTNAAPPPAAAPVPQSAVSQAA